jgi:hypothetical protein
MNHLKYLSCEKVVMDRHRLNALNVLHETSIRDLFALIKEWASVWNFSFVSKPGFYDLALHFYNFRELPRHMLTQSIN